MLLLCEAILEEPEGFHLKKEKQKKPKQAPTHKFACDTESRCSKGWHPFKVEELEQGKGMQ